MKTPVLLLICVSGIYSTFLTWGYFQEKVTSSNYSQDASIEIRFHAPLILNIIQCLFSVLTGSLYLKFQYPKSSIWIKDTASVKTLYAISVSQSISTPLSYMSLDYVDYMLYLLAKSCKLIPLLTVHFLLYGTVYPPHKYLIASIITSGVGIFTIGGMKSSNSSSSSGDESSSILFGLFLLLGSLLLDGFMNSSQDALFKKNKSITGAHLMIYLNFFTMINLILYTIMATNQWQDLFNFINNNGHSVLYDIFNFSISGALGQIFIFLTLQNFSSVVLVTVTVTRKMLSMVLSVLLFGHVLNYKQWLGIVLVFVGVIGESLMKIIPKTKKETKTA